MKKLVEVLVKALVDTPDQVAVNQDESEHHVAFQVRVAPDDIGKVIGRHGRVARAIRLVLKAAAIRDGRRVSVEFDQ